MTAKASGRWWVLVNVVLVNVIVTGIAWNYLIMFVPDVTRDLGIAVSSWGALWAGIPLGVLLFSLPAGALGDRFGGRMGLGAGLALAGLALSTRSLVVGPVSMFLSMVGFGLALSLVMAVFPKAIAQVFPASELGMANGFAQAGVGLGLGSATLLAPLLSESAGGWRGLSAGLAVASFVLAGVWLASFREPAPEAPLGALPAADRSSIREVLRVAPVRWIALAYALYMGGYLGAVGYLPTYLTTRQGIAPETAGALMSLGPWCFTLGSMILPALSDKVGRRIVYLPGMILGGLGLFAASLTSGVPLGLSIAILGFGTGVVGLLFVIPVELPEVGPQRAASAVGAITAAGFLGGFVSPLVGMPIVEAHAATGFGLWTACFVASALLIARVPKGVPAPAIAPGSSA